MICKKCGKEHRLGLENKENGSFTPIDVCYDCLMFATFRPLRKKIKLNTKRKRKMRKRL